MRPGSQLRDEGEIARGGMGSIRRLYDPELRRHIAMKVLEPSADPNAAQRFVDEARITGVLDHANIVPVHDLVIDNRGVATYTMKLVEGQTMSELISSQRTQRDLERILQCLIKVCDALSFAHSRGVIHRDLKPDNIMVGSHGQVYVMDWGCAQVIGDDRSIVEGRVDPDGMVIGTVAYMAPEQALGHVTKIDQRTDVFGVGAILYKALTGMAPYPGPVMVALMRAQLCEVQPPDERTGIAVKPPPHLSQIVMKAMQADPANRFQTVDELAEELRAFLRGGNWFPLHKFAAGSVIVREGDRADAAYIITSGRCEVRKTDPNDPKRTIVLRTLKAGDVFGETAIFADTPRSATVVALEEVSAVLVERSAIDNLTRSSWLGLFVKSLADRFLDVDAQLSKLRKQP
jgi:serine/threonine-protein kinase